jgi:hypothetical protein
MKARRGATHRSAAYRRADSEQVAAADVGTNASQHLTIGDDGEKLWTVLEAHLWVRSAKLGSPGSRCRANSRRALVWTKAATLVADTHVPDDIYDKARAAFSEQELVDLTMAVVTIDGWNRLMVSFRIPRQERLSRPLLSRVTSRSESSGGFRILWRGQPCVSGHVTLPIDRMILVVTA